MSVVETVSSAASKAKNIAPWDFFQAKIISPLFKTFLVFFLRPVEIFRMYELQHLQPDLVAGLTVAVITLPQAMAYALIAELPPEVGLYSAIVGAIVGGLWGSSNHLQTGPTNTTSLLILSILLGIAVPGTEAYIIAAGMMAILVGVIRLFMGLARLGVLVNFVSDSVIVGFTAGAGILIFINQIRNLLRLDIPSAPSLWQTIPNLVTNMSTTHWSSLIIGAITMVLIIGLKKVNRKLPGPLIGMVVASAFVALLRLDARGVKVVGELPRGLPPLAKLPLLDTALIGRLAVGAGTVAAIGLVEAMSIARSIASHTGERLDSNQEFIGQGLSSLACGFFSGYTSSGSFTRSAVDYEVGAKTSLSSLFSGVFVLIAMLVLAPLAAYVPQPALAGVLILTAYSLIDQKEIIRIWQASNSDRNIMVVTLLATLALPLQFAVITGIGMSVVYYLLKTSTPRVRVVLPSDDFRYFTPRPGKPSCTQLGVVEILGDLYFGAVSHIEERIQGNLTRNPTQRFLLLRMYPVENCDISGIHTLESIVRGYRERHGDVFFVHVQQPVLTLMQTSGFYDYVGADHFLDPDEAVSYLFHRLMDPAICIYECPVKVFRYCQNLPKRLDLVGIHLDTGTALEDVPTVMARDLWKDLHSVHPPVIIDVREPREFKGGHIPNSQLLSLSDLIDDVTRVPHDDPVVLVCQGGRRSSRAAAMLRHRGHTNVTVLQDGMIAWEREKLLEAVELRR